MTVLPRRRRPTRPAPCGAGRLLLPAGALLFLLFISDRPAVAEPLRIAGTGHLADLPTLIADRHGLFRRNGLRARLRYGDSGSETLALLRAGEVEVALMTPTPLVLDRLSDPTPGEADDPVILASLVHSAHFSQIFVPPDSEIQTAAGLEGRRIGLQHGTHAEVLWWQFAALHGLNDSTVTLVDLPAARLVQALAAGGVDAAVLWQPWIGRLEQELGAPPRRLDQGLYTVKWLVVGSRRLPAEAPRQVRALLRAYRDAIDHIERRPRRALRHYAEHVGVPPALVRWPDIALDYDLSLDWSLIAALQQQLEWARRDGRVPVAGPVAVQEMIDAAPLAAVMPAGVSIPETILDVAASP